MNARLNNTVQLLRHFGPGWLMFRVGYALRRRSGMLRRTLPATTWDRQPLASFLRDPQLANVEAYAEARRCSNVRFLFTPDDADAFRPLFKTWDATSRGPVAAADAIEDGVFRFFEHHDINLGCPPNWHLNPITGDVVSPRSALDPDRRLRGRRRQTGLGAEPVRVGVSACAGLLADG